MTEVTEGDVRGGRVSQLYMAQQGDTRKGHQRSLFVRPPGGHSIYRLYVAQVGQSPTVLSDESQIICPSGTRRGLTATRGRSLRCAEISPRFVSLLTEFLACIDT